ncbi:diaminopimelate decarboxylase [Acidovorax delafieldii]|uniref:Diaminopimelate decarboxylase n=1 Tax=Acidovorax delafieldii TaxID=47920 RepID=A0AAJ2C2C1_ACIDE|nr:diaminopimelate decarboxylase [Acidovorax delafieldii]MDR6768820.1 diaminopimelate decarboxylase [Acidovorax delafieldii]MDR6837536.1 diaminopimelate decarboxylase [Acidovorax delafieldii]MDR7367026.1 diaminopimelate decarboxylase [Acidovorax delafieldii]
MSNPFSPAQLWALADQFGTPLWVYDAATIRQRIAQVSNFETIRFAQKACSNIHILKLMREQGVKVDAVSRGEILRALAAGYVAGGEPSEIVFTADLFDAATLDCVVEHGVPVNAGSIDMLHQLGARSPGHAVWLRINPGFGHGHSNKTNTGGEHSKHGIWHTDLPAALAAIKQHGLKLVGLHMHIGSGVDYSHLQEVCGAMVNLVRIAHAAGHDLHAISAGGGLSIPYRSGDPVVDTQHYHGLWDAARQQAEAIVGHKLGLEIEPGRFLVAESGVLLGQVRATKNAGSNHFVLVDTGFNELMRPSMYGSYHAMSVLRRDGSTAAEQPTVVAGPLCESGDVFTQGDGGVVLPRDLPAAQVGDLLVIHDTGAYGASMSSNYNTRPLIAEVLVDGGQARLIRRRQTVDELLALELGL